MAPSPPPQKLLVLLSGSGSNFAAVLAATQPSGALHGLAQITHVISNRKSAYGLQRAADASIPMTYHNLVSYKKSAPTEATARSKYDADLARLILAEAPDVVVCAGWMHILSPSFLDPIHVAGVDIINLHPALPGCFDGKDAIKRAWEAFANGEIKETGVMIHHVIDVVDRGEPIVVRKIDMQEGESLESLEERIHSAEHDAIVEGTKIVIKGRRRKWAAENAGKEAL